MTKLSGQESLSCGDMAVFIQADLKFRMSQIPETPEERDSLRASRLENQKQLLQFIPQWLRYRGLNQRTLAEHLKTTQASLSKWLSGTDQMPAGVLRQIAAFLTTHPGDLIRPPDEAGLGTRVEETLHLMEALDADEWDQVLAIARAIAKAKTSKVS